MNGKWVIEVKLLGNIYCTVCSLSEKEKEGVVCSFQEKNGIGEGKNILAD